MIVRRNKKCRIDLPDAQKKKQYFLYIHASQGLFFLKNLLLHLSIKFYGDIVMCRTRSVILFSSCCGFIKSRICIISPVVHKHTYCLHKHPNAQELHNTDFTPLSI